MKRNEPQSKPQLFIIADEIWQNSSIDEIDATVEDMQAMDIFYPPCRHFEVVVSAEITLHMLEDFKFSSPKYIDYYKNNHYRVEVEILQDENWSSNCIAELTHKLMETGEWVGANWLANKNFIEGVITKERYEMRRSEIASTTSHIIRVLLVALATKNIVRKNGPSRMAKQVIKPTAIKRDYEYTTTLTIGKVVGSERTEGDTGGWKVRPHLRRGHIREQRYGPNNQLLKKVFIQPVFVNAADGVMSQRKAYNVRVA